jgi:hypothetical protein
MLLDSAQQGRMALPLFVTISYLKESLDAPIPTWFLRGLYQASAKADLCEQEVALYGIQTNARGGLTKIIQNCDDWQTRAFVLKWAFLPSRDFMRSIYEVRSSFLLPIYYLYRPLRFLVRWSWFSGKRVGRRLSENLGAPRTMPKVVSHSRP